MWLSERAAGRAGGGVRAEVGTVTVGGRDPAVLLDGESRNLGRISPGGLSWMPAVGDEVLVLETGDGERWILGAADGGIPSLRDGEVCLRCGGAWLKLGQDGSISAEGDLHLNGDVYITGRLYLNGVEITAEAD